MTTRLKRVLADPAVDAVIIATPGIADVALVTLTFASGVIANVELSWLAPSKLRRTVLVGSERMVMYDDGASDPVRLFDSGVVYRGPETFGEYHLSYRSGDILSPRIESHEPLGLELADFVTAIRTKEGMWFHTALTRSVVRIVEGADRSLRQGGRQVALPPRRCRPGARRRARTRVDVDGLARPQPARAALRTLPQRPVASQRAIVGASGHY